MTLLDHIRSLNQAAVMPVSFGLGMDNSPIERDISAGYSVAAIDETLAKASDADVVEAYRQTGGTKGDLAAEILLAEVKRRNLAL